MNRQLLIATLLAATALSSAAAYALPASRGNESVTTLQKSTNIGHLAAFGSDITVADNRSTLTGNVANNSNIQVKNFFGTIQDYFTGQITDNPEGANNIHHNTVSTLINGPTSSKNLSLGNYLGANATYNTINQKLTGVDGGEIVNSPMGPLYSSGFSTNISGGYDGILATNNIVNLNLTGKQVGNYIGVGIFASRDNVITNNSTNSTDNIISTQVGFLGNQWNWNEFSTPANHNTVTNTLDSAYKNVINTAFAGADSNSSLITLTKAENLTINSMFGTQVNYDGFIEKNQNGSWNIHDNKVSVSTTLGAPVSKNTKLDASLDNSATYNTIDFTLNGVDGGEIMNTPMGPLYSSGFYTYIVGGPNMSPSSNNKLTFKLTGNQAGNYAGVGIAGASDNIVTNDITNSTDNFITTQVGLDSTNDMNAPAFVVPTHHNTSINTLNNSSRNMINTAFYGADSNLSQVTLTKAENLTINNMFGTQMDWNNQIAKNDQSYGNIYNNKVYVSTLGTLVSKNTRVDNTMSGNALSNTVRIDLTGVDGGEMMNSPMGSLYSSGFSTHIAGGSNNLAASNNNVTFKLTGKQAGNYAGVGIEGSSFNTVTTSIINSTDNIITSAIGNHDYKLPMNATTGPGGVNNKIITTLGNLKASSKNIITTGINYGTSGTSFTPTVNGTNNILQLGTDVDFDANGLMIFRAPSQVQHINNTMTANVNGNGNQLKILLAGSGNALTSLVTGDKNKQDIAIENGNYNKVNVTQISPAGATLGNTATVKITGGSYDTVNISQNGRNNNVFANFIGSYNANGNATGNVTPNLAVQTGDNNNLTYIGTGSNITMGTVTQKGNNTATVTVNCTSCVIPSLTQSANATTPVTLTYNKK